MDLVIRERKKEIYHFIFMMIVFFTMNNDSLLYPSVGYFSI